MRRHLKPSQILGWVSRSKLVLNSKDQIAFIADQSLAITKEIVELTDSSGGSNFVLKMPRKGKRFEDNAVVFYEKVGIFSL